MRCSSYTRLIFMEITIMHTKIFYKVALLFPLIFATHSIIAKDLNPLTYESISIRDVDENANFKICGYRFRAVINNDNWDTMLQVLIYKNRNNDYFVSTGLAKRENRNSNWKVRDSVVQWVRVGSEAPLLLDPYNLMTDPNRGSSTFSVKKDDSFNLFSEFERATVPIWARIYDKISNTTHTYIGEATLNKETLVATNNCLSDMRHIK